MEIITTIQHDLLVARKAGDQLQTQTLQALLTRITNAEAVSATDMQSRAGVGTTEVTRKQLSEEDVKTIIRQEKAEIDEALASMADHTDHPYAQELQHKATIIAAYIS